MRTIPSESVDAVITDPPYETTGLHFDKPGRIDWDLFYSEIRRVLKLNGWFFMFGTLEMYKKASDYFRFRFQYVWVKDNFALMSQSAMQPYQIHENIWCFLQKDLKKISTAVLKRDELKTYGHEPYSRAEHIKDGEWVKSKGGGNVITPEKIDRTWRHGTTVLYYSRQQGFGHCTTKPVELIKYLLGGYTNEGDTVLDPFMGSGTTAVACQDTNRNYIGIEMHEPYVEIANRRLLEARNLFTDPKFTQPQNDATINELDTKQGEMF
jgi:site-specific DNA-methyltransferase (adenine-specific)